MTDAPKPRSFTRDAFGSVGAKIAMLASTFLGGIVLSRVLGADGRGVLAAVLVYPTLLVSLSELGVRQAAVRFLGEGKHPRGEIAAVVYGLLGVASTIGVVACLLLYSRGSSVPLDPILLGLGASIIPARLAVSYASGILLGEERIGTFNRVQWLPEGLKFVGILILVAGLGLGVAGAVASTVVGLVVIAVYATRLALRSMPRLPRPSLRLTVAMLRLGSVYALGFFIMTLNYRIDIILLERLGSPSEVGQYAQGVALTELVWQIPVALGVVVFSRSANARARDGFTRELTRLVRATMLVTIVAGAVMAVAAGPLVPLVYGAEFTPSVTVIRLLLPGVIAFTVFKILNFDLAGRGRPMVSVLVFLPSVAVNVGLNLLWIPEHGAAGAAAASSVSYLLGAVTFTYAYCRVAGISFRELARPRRDDFAPLLRKLARLRGGIR